MQISKVEAIPFAVPVRSLADAHTGFNTSNAVLVKIYSEECTDAIVSNYISENDIFIY